MRFLLSGSWSAKSSDPSRNIVAIFYTTAFYTPVFEGTYYGMASSVCPSVSLSVCLFGPCSRKLQDHLISIMRGICLLFSKVGGQRSRSYCHIHVVGKRSRHDTEWTVTSRIIQLDTIDHHDERKMPIVFQVWRSKVKVILSHSRKRGRIHCRQDPDLDWTNSSRILQLGTYDHHDKRKMPFVIQGQRSSS